MKKFSKNWVASKKPNKQRKYRFNAPMHLRGALLNAHLSKELRDKYGIRSLRVRTGDQVRIMRGQFKKLEGKVEEVNMKRLKVYIAKTEHVKRDGSKARYPIEPSNLLIVELNTDDKERMASLKKEASTVKPKSEKPVEKKDAEKKTPKAAKTESTQTKKAPAPKAKKSTKE